MKKSQLALILSLWTLILWGIQGEEENSIILQAHPLNIDEARKEISEICKTGFTPLGLEIQSNNTMIISYVTNSGINFTQWNLVQFTDYKKINTQFADFLKDGWFPTGFSKTPGAVYVLFLKTGYKIEGFRIVEGEMNEGVIKETLQSALKARFIPCGLSYSENKLWYLLIKSDDIKITDVYLGAYENNPASINAGLKQVMAQGYLPWTLCTGPDSLLVLHVK